LACFAFISAVRLTTSAAFVASLNACAQTPSQLAFEVFARVTPKMLARFINTRTAQPAFLPLPDIREATLDLPVAHLRRFFTQGAAKCAQCRNGIYANSDDETDSLERRARDMVRMHGNELRHSGEGSFRLFSASSSIIVQIPFKAAAGGVAGHRRALRIDRLRLIKLAKPVSPGSIKNSEGSTNVLKPVMRSLVSFIGYHVLDAASGSGIGRAADQG
jgi:hypothetical protein